jgi:hypothetical protein
MRRSVEAMEAQRILLRTFISISALPWGSVRCDLHCRWCVALHARCRCTAGPRLKGAGRPLRLDLRRAVRTGDGRSGGLRGLRSRRGRGRRFAGSRRAGRCRSSLSEGRARDGNSDHERCCHDPAHLETFSNRMIAGDTTWVLYKCSIDSRMWTGPRRVTGATQSDFRKRGRHLRQPHRQRSAQSMPIGWRDAALIRSSWRAAANASTARQSGFLTSASESIAISRRGPDFAQPLLCINNERRQGVSSLPRLAGKSRL